MKTEVKTIDKVNSVLKDIELNHKQDGDKFMFTLELSKSQLLEIKYALEKAMK